jgi:hypothetical protein
VTRRDAFEDDLTEEDRWPGMLPARQVTAPSGAFLAGNSPLNWPNGHQGFGMTPEQIAMLGGAVMHPEMARIPFPDAGRWLVHVVPTVFGVAVDVCALWANSEPNHALGTSIPIGLGILAGAGTVVAAVVGNQPAETETDNRNHTGTKLLGGGSVALLSIGAMTGAGVSGFGFLGALGCLGGLNAGWVAFLNWRRNRNQNVLIALTEAAAAGQQMMPPPYPGGVYVEQLEPAPNAQASNPFEATFLAAMESMGFAGTVAGAPKAITENAWKIRGALPKGRNNSPERLVAMADVLASNMDVRRAEIEALGGNLFEATLYDGPDILGRGYVYPWDRTSVSSLAEPIAIGIDEAGRPLEITIDDHILISGKTGGGKSKLVQLLVARTLGAQDVVRIGIDCKPGAVELGLFEESMHMLAKNTLDAVRVHHGLKALIDERGLILQENDADTWRPEFGTEILVASDERAVVLRDFPDAGPLIEHNMQMGRFVKVKFLDATQTPSGGVYGKRTDARHQYGIRIGFYNESTVNTMVFGGKATSDGWRLERLENAPGKMLVRCYGHNVPRPYKSLLAARSEIQELVARFADQFPELDERSAEAFARGIAEFDAAIEGGENPQPPKRPRGGADFDESVEPGGRPNLRLVPSKYPDGTKMPETRRVLWNAISKFDDGFTYRDIVALNLPGYARRSSIQDPLDTWRARGWVEEVDKRGNAIVFKLNPDAERIRKDA